MTVSGPLILGHRGAPRRARENTLEAFSLARQEGADGVELDVHCSADGVLIVHHDAEIDGFGILASEPWSTIVEAFPWMPTLADVLDTCGGMLVNIEVKNSPGDADFDPDERVAITVVGLLQARGAGRDDVIVSSFHLPSITRVRSLDSEIPTGYLTGFHVGPHEALDAVVVGGHRAIHPFFGVLADQGAETLVTAAHARGVAVNTWTVNDADEIARLEAAGVDAIITDVPADARAALVG